MDGPGPKDDGSRSDEVPDPEVVPNAPRRRRYTAEYKLAILRETDPCTENGQIGAILRREGLYYSHLTKWRDARTRGELEALTPRPRGPKPKRDARDLELDRLKRELARVQERLRVAEIVCDAQKKVAEILGITLAKPEEHDGKSS